MQVRGLLSLLNHDAQYLAIRNAICFLTLNLRDKGVTTIIGKPFQTAGRTLDRVIKRALGENGQIISPARQIDTVLKAKTVAVPDIKVNTLPVKTDADLPLDVENKAAPPAGKAANILTKEQRGILEAVAQNPQEAMLQVEIVVAGGYSKHVTRQCLEALRKHGLVHRPHGPRKGDAVTEKGLAILGGKARQSG